MASVERDFLRLLPKVLRAREFHLYLEGGKRLTDLWLDGGRAVLGHKRPRVLGELKNAGERGLFAPLPHPSERRFLKALELLFPGKAFRLYSGEAPLCRALKEAGFELPENTASFPDPAFHGGAAAGEISLWRPFLETPGEGGGSAPVVLPVLPWPFGPSALVLEKSMDAAFPAGELIPPVLLTPAARALYDLLAVQKAKAPRRGVFPKVEKALKKSVWRGNGIYLTLDPETEKYKELFLRFLEGGFLLPPSPWEPAILPQTMSDGEESKLAGLIGG